MTPGELAARWRAARPVVAGLHLDSAACSRQSLAAIDAAAQHARHEGEVGGYVAAAAAAPALNAGRAAVAALTGMRAEDVTFTTGSSNALDLLLGGWPVERRTLACLPGEFGPNLAVMAAHGFAVRQLPVDGEGRLDLDAAAMALSADPPAMVHLTAVASHRGIVQPMSAAAQVCRRLGVPLVVDAAQAFGQIDCVVGADAVYSSSRKWIAGPRGVGFLATRPEFVAPSVLERVNYAEANIAARIGFSIAVGEHLSAGPAVVRTRLAEIGSMTRATLAGVPGWRVGEASDEPTAITTLLPPDGVDPHAVRSWLIAERGILTTVVDVERAPFELFAPVLRVSPHVDTTADDLELFANTLIETKSIRQV